jgi:hypothetical protein
VREAQEIAGLVAAGVVPCLAYLAIGLRLLTWTGVASRGAERLALAWVLGTGSASLAILLLRALDVPLPLLALAAVAVLAWLLPRRGAGPARSGAPSPGAAPWVRAVDIATGGVAALSFVVALGPETAWDGFEYHLPLVRAWTEGPVRALPGMIDAEFRAGVDLLFAPAVGAGWPDAAAAVSAGFALALAALVRAEASRRASPGAGALAGWFTLVVPLTLQLAPTTYVDLGVGAYGFLGLLGVDRWNRGAERRELLLSALYLGFAVNAKLSAAVLCPAALALALLGGRRPAVSVLARCAAVVALVTAPWFAKVAITTGNPFFPFLGGWLGTGPADAGFVELRKLRSLANYPVRRDAPGLLSYLASITFGRNPHVGGLLGPLPLALAPLALGRVGRATVVLTVTLATLVGLQFFFLPALRFGTPLWPFLGVAAAVGGRRLAASGPAARALLAAVLAFLAIHHTAAAAVWWPGPSRWWRSRWARSPGCPSPSTTSSSSATESWTSGRERRRLAPWRSSSVAVCDPWCWTSGCRCRPTAGSATRSWTSGCARAAPRWRRSCPPCRPAPAGSGSWCVCSPADAHKRGSGAQRRGVREPAASPPAGPARGAEAPLRESG